ncbi:MAG: hypothetical protein ACFFA0_09850, partial [Promethearchaeota archaeon]
MHLSTTIVIILATLIFASVCFKRRDLFSWAFAYIAVSLSEVFRLFSQAQYDTLELISITFSALGVLVFIIAVAKEYFQTFLKKPKTLATTFLLFINGQIIATIGLQSSIALFLFIALFLSIKIYFKKKTPTHAFMSFILSTGILQLIASILRDIGIPGGNDFLEFTRIVMATMMLITGVIAIIEDKIVRSESKYRVAYNRAEFYKDLFIHDINNILQNLQFSLEVISQNLGDSEKKENLDELVKIANNQVIRGAELGLNVKKLSDLEIGVIKREPIKLYDILDNAINVIKTNFYKEEIKIEFARKPEIIFVNANVLLEDVFRIILNNAIKYNDSSIKEILIKISKETNEFGSNIKIEFKD